MHLSNEIKRTSVNLLIYNEQFFFLNLLIFIYLLLLNYKLYVKLIHYYIFFLHLNLCTIYLFIIFLL